jgi:hypothetical protein
MTQYAYHWLYRTNSYLRIFITSVFARICRGCICTRKFAQSSCHFALWYTNRQWTFAVARRCISRNATEREQVGSPWSPRAMLSTYRVICTNTDNFSHDSVRLILLQRMFSGPVTLGRNNVHHKQKPNEIVAFISRSARFIYRKTLPYISCSSLQWNFLHILNIYMQSIQYHVAMS